jgi:hypothetical protein
MEKTVIMQYKFNNSGQPTSGGHLGLEIDRDWQTFTIKKLSGYEM